MPTTGIDLDNEWRKVADTPCLLERSAGTIGIYFGTEKPEKSQEAYHKLNEQDRFISYSGAAGTFARNISADKVSKLIVTGAS